MEFDEQVIETGLDQILEIAEERKANLERLKEAVLAADHGKIRKYASLLCGPKEEELGP
jgi:hypothetical protein